MGTATVILGSRETREQVCRWVMKAPPRTVVTLRGVKRSIPQNDLLHALITEIATQVEWAGARRDVEAWKDIFTAALRSANHGLDVVPGINGGFVLLGMHTSAMTKDECGQLIELIYAFGAEHGVTFREAEAA